MTRNNSEFATIRYSICPSFTNSFIKKPCYMPLQQFLDQPSGSFCDARTMNITIHNIAVKVANTFCYIFVEDVL